MEYKYLLGNIKGEKGDKGDAGEKGERGEKGEQGEKGERGLGLADSDRTFSRAGQIAPVGV